MRRRGAERSSEAAAYDPSFDKRKSGLPTSHRVRRATQHGGMARNVSLYYGLVPELSRRVGEGVPPAPAGSFSALDRQLGFFITVAVFVVIRMTPLAPRMP